MSDGAWRAIAWFLESGIPFLMRIGSIGALVLIVGSSDMRVLWGWLAVALLLDLAHGWRDAAKKDPLFPNERRRNPIKVGGRGYGDD